MEGNNQYLVLITSTPFSFCPHQSDTRLLEPKPPNNEHETPVPKNHNPKTPKIRQHKTPADETKTGMYQCVIIILKGSACSLCKTLVVLSSFQVGIAWPLNLLNHGSSGKPLCNHWEFSTASYCSCRLQLYLKNWAVGLFNSPGFWLTAICHSIDILGSFELIFPIPVIMTNFSIDANL